MRRCQRSSSAWGLVPLGLRDALCAILRREDHVGAFADGFGAGETEKALGTRVPAGGNAALIDGKDREIEGTLDDDLEQLSLVSQQVLRGGA
nr:hypothetical protein [Methylobacterium nodulans]